MKDFLTFFGLAFSALLPLINPLGSALVFMSIVGPAPVMVYRRLAARIAVTTTLFLVVIELTGATLMKFFGISLPVMQVSGGLVLAAMGWHLLFQEQAASAASSNGTVQKERTGTLDGRVFYPFTFPITAGPAAIVVVITLSAQASAERGFSDFVAHGGIAAAAVLLGVLVYVCYAYAPRISARIKPDTAHGIQRVIAFVLLSIGVQIIWNGLDILLGSIR